MKYVTIVLHIIALLFLPLYWVTNIYVVGIIGYASLSLGSISLIIKSIASSKK